uniref:Uncharacterized protein n=1 Tax=Panagrellus redivivus TaxID=6233 RepID=A0A7E4W3Q2_PANRE
MNATRYLLRLIFAAVMISLIASEALSTRVRPDKKAMRNSLVRFGKRAEVAAYAPLDDDAVQDSSIVDTPWAYNGNRFIYPRIQDLIQ